MSRTLLVLLLGLGVGAGTHAAYFHFHRFRVPDSADGKLAWIKDELHLTDAQYAQIKELHEASSPRLRALALDVARMRTEFAAFENTRRQSDQVDFIEFARFVETRRTINRECLESTRRLVMATARVMTPEQRAHYLGMVATIDPLEVKTID